MIVTFTGFLREASAECLVARVARVFVAQLVAQHVWSVWSGMVGPQPTPTSISSDAQPVISQSSPSSMCQVCVHM